MGQFWEGSLVDPKMALKRLQKNILDGHFCAILGSFGISSQNLPTNMGLVGSGREVLLTSSCPSNDYKQESSWSFLGQLGVIGGSLAEPPNQHVSGRFWETGSVDLKVAPKLLQKRSPDVHLWAILASLGSPSQNLPTSMGLGGSGREMALSPRCSQKGCKKDS